MFDDNSGEEKNHSIFENTGDNSIENAEDQNVDGKRRRHRLLEEFDEDTFMSSIMERKAKRELCFWRTCMSKISEKYTQASTVIYFIQSIKTSELRNRV